MKKIWLIRHSECHSNIGDKTTDPATSTLTARGLLQSERIAACIADQPDLIVHSRYSRSLQSAQPVLKKFPQVAVEEWPIHEFIYLPHAKYCNTTQSERQAAVAEYWQSCEPEYKSSAEAESFVEFINRMEMIIKMLKNNDGHIIVFTHGHVIRAMIWRIITGRLLSDKNAMEQYRSLRHALYIPNAVILKVSLSKSEMQMSQLITSHLMPELLT